MASFYLPISSKALFSIMIEMLSKNAKLLTLRVIVLPWKDKKGQNAISLALNSPEEIIQSCFIGFQAMVL